MNDKRITEILKGISVIIDTREHSEGNCANIMNWMGVNSIKYTQRCLKFGDYSFEVNGESYENRLVLERKSGLTELSSNVSQHRERFVSELQRSKDAGAKLILMVEDGSWQDIIEHKYRTELSPKSYMASLLSFQSKFGIDIQFIPKQYAGMFIYSQFYYMLRNELKQMEAI